MQKLGALKRYMMRCTSCKSCSHACPFGTIYPETIPFLIARCDFCLGRIGNEGLPICLESCTYGGIQYGEFEENKEAPIYKISEYLMVKSDYKWERAEETPLRKR
jgi:Fe-S-cluster-containing dehydrogenase component